MSIVSTKIPFKGTGKEYIGDDIKEIASAVKVSFEVKLRVTTVETVGILTVYSSRLLFSSAVSN